MRWALFAAVLSVAVVGSAGLDSEDIETGHRALSHEVSITTYAAPRRPWGRTSLAATDQNASLFHARDCCVPANQGDGFLTTKFRGGPKRAHVPGSETVLMKAARLGEAGACRIILRAGANIDEVTTSGMTALHFAAKHGHVEVVAALVKFGAKVNLAENSGATPLFTAAHGGFTDVVSVLVDAGAQIEKANNFGLTPLHTACKEGKTAVTKVLLDSGAERNVVTNKGETAMQLARRGAHPGCVQLLLQHTPGVARSRPDLPHLRLPGISVE